jgi:tetratricopeptide (TPR) repeat protein
MTASPPVAVGVASTIGVGHPLAYARAMKRAPFLLALLLSCPAFAKPVPRIWDVSPLGQMMRADMAQAGRSGLEQLVTTLGTRLILTTESVGVDQLGDVELLWRLATGVQMLTEVSEPSADLMRVERATAFALFTIGQRYQTRDDFRFALDGLEAEPTGNGRHLLGAVRGMKDYGAEWFEAAYAKLDKAGALDAESRHQLGRIYLDTGRAPQAATLLSEVFAQAPDRELARSMCEAMMAVGEPAIATRLSSMKDKLAGDGLMGLADEISNCIAWHEDEVASLDFEKKLAAQTLEKTDLVAQIARLQRLDRVGAADALARQAAQLDPDVGLVAAAELFFKLERWQSLATIFADAKQRGFTDERLVHLEALAQAGLAVRQALGSAVADGKDADRAIESSTLPPLVKLGQLAMVRTAQWMGAPPETRAEALAAVDKTVADLLSRHGGEPTALGVVLIAMLGTERLDAGLKLLAPKLQALEKAAKKNAALAAPIAEIRSLVARVELGMGFRERDKARIARAVTAMKKIGAAERKALGVSKAAELELAEVTGALALEALGGGIKSTKLIESLREWDLSGANRTGRVTLQARAMLLGTMALLGGQDGVAVSRWLEARSLHTGSVGFLAAGLVQRVTGDHFGAGTLCARAELGERPALAQLLAACVAQGAEGEGAKKAWGEVLSHWRGARLPDGPLPAVRPLFYGTFEIGVKVVAGEPLELILDARPVVTLVPELVEERARVEELAR